MLPARARLQPIETRAARNRPRFRPTRIDPEADACAHVCVHRIGRASPLPERPVGGPTPSGSHHRCGVVLPCRPGILRSQFECTQPYVMYLVVMRTIKPRKRPSELEYRLLSLLAKERGGRDLAQEYAKSGGETIAYGTLYVVLGRMRDAGWIKVRTDPNGDGRARLFSLKGEGTYVLNERRMAHEKLAGLPRGAF